MTTTHEQSIEEIIKSNVSTAVDQCGSYDFQEDETCPWYEGDAYAQNVVDTCLEMGYTKDEAGDALLGFIEAAKASGCRFA